MLFKAHVPFDVSMLVPDAQYARHVTVLPDSNAPHVCARKELYDRHRANVITEPDFSITSKLEFQKCPAHILGKEHTGAFI